MMNFKDFHCQQFYMEMSVVEINYLILLMLSNPIKFQDIAIILILWIHNNIIINPNSNICISRAPEDNLMVI